MDVFYNDVNHASIDLLKAQGQVVEVPEQTCCGALAAHAGESDIMEELAKKNIAYFEQTTGPIVVTSAGCGAMLKEYAYTFAKDAQWAERASNFSKRVVDITEQLAMHNFKRPVDAAPLPAKKIAYHAACHLPTRKMFARRPKSF